jgi:hypothetical protein
MTIHFRHYNGQDDYNCIGGFLIHGLHQTAGKDYLKFEQRSFK